MLTVDRQRFILDLLDREGSVSLATLRAALPVTMMTLWRDLAALEARGRLRRVRGGALRPDMAEEPPFDQKKQRAFTRKRRIAARAAAEFVAAGDALFLEGGTTIAQLLPHLTASGLVVLTNSLPILNRAHAQHPKLTLQCSGGMFSPVSGNFIGPDAVAFFQRKRARTFFMSATGLDPATGQLTDPNPLEIEVKRAMARQAERIVLLLDSTKLSLVSLEAVLPLDRIDALVIDDGAAPAVRRKLATFGPKIVVA